VDELKEHLRRNYYVPHLTAVLTEAPPEPNEPGPKLIDTDSQGGPAAPVHLHLRCLGEVKPLEATAPFYAGGKTDVGAYLKKTSPDLVTLPPPEPPRPRDPRWAAHTCMKIIRHSPILFWWPLWMYGFILALVSYVDGEQVALVPAGTRAEAVAGPADAA